tara:strand:- start:34431 stop:35768 length:1338 start_codon:yes stop_codon:yes gene_type:complete
MKNLMKKFSISPFEQIKKKIKCKDFKVAIIGLGYVGLPLALNFCENEIKVIGIDINEDYLNKLKKGESYIHHIPSNRINKQIKNNFFYPTNDFKNISEADALIICVPTPLTNHREPDIRYIISTLESINKHIREGQIIILESTTYPGTTEEVIQPRLEKEGFKIGDNLFLVYSPEREDPGNKTYNSNNTPKILGGTTKKCSILGKMVYENIINNIVVVSSTKVAEMTKLVENVHRAVNIGLVNELKTLTDSLKIDIYEVINAAATKPFGFTPFYPGPGLGGHCIPIDPFYLSWKAKEFDVNLKFIELAGEINSSMPKYILEKISTSLNAISKSLKDSNILILGLSYKKNVDDIRESPALKLIKLLLKSNAKVTYSDPFHKKVPDSRKYNFKIKGIKITPKNLQKFDCVVLTTDHDCFDYEMIKNYSRLIIDTRGKFKLNKKIIRG